MEIKGKNVLVTGANRGLGRTFAQTLLKLGAAKVYAGARDPSTVDLPGAIPVRLDVTDPTTIIVSAATARVLHRRGGALDAGAIADECTLPVSVVRRRAEGSGRATVLGS